MNIRKTRGHIDWKKWKQIIGYNGIYRISSFGEVKSIRNGNEKILKAGITRGYYIVGLSKNGKRTTNYIHSLMSVTFLGYDKSNKKLVPDHKDGVKLNNKISNIKIVTRRENVSVYFRRDRNKLSSKLAGVSWNKRDKKWYSQIYINGKRKYLGIFNTEIEASNAYQKELISITI